MLTITGTISRCAVLPQSNQVVFMLEGDQARYRFSVAEVDESTVEEILLTKQGDKVRIKTVELELCDGIQEWNNLTLYRG